MKLIDGIKLKGRGVEIPDCGRDDLPLFFVEMGYKIGIEIGTFKGDFTKKFCEVGLEMYTVDPWLAYEDYNVRNQPFGIFQSRQDALYEEAKKILAPYSNCKIIRKTSMEAVKDFKNKSLDFVYIDAHHGLRYMIEDLWEWNKKIKIGGAISGHDYALNKKSPYDPYVLHGKYAVDAFTSAFRIQNWYILGNRFPKLGEYRDKWRSYLWIKRE